MSVQLGVGRQVLFSALNVLAVMPADGSEAGSAAISTTGKVSIATDYVFRGVSQTREEPQIQADITWSHDSSLYAGAWASNTNFGGRGNSMEIDPFIGFAGKLGDTDWGYDVGYWQYHYPGAQASFDYGEFYLRLMGILDQLNLTAGLWYAPDFFGEDFFEDGASLAYQASFSHPLPNEFSLTGAVGWQSFEEPAALPEQDYLYFNIGVTRPWRGFTFDVRYHDTDDVQPELVDADEVDGRLVLKATKSF